MDQIRWASQRSNEIFKSIPFLQAYHTLCGSSYGLEYDRDRSLFSVVITDGKWNTFTLLINFYNNKLSRFAILRNTRSLDIHKIDLVCQFFSSNDWIHVFPPCIYSLPFSSL